MSTTQGSIILPAYGSGEYFKTHSVPDQDDRFKADAFLKLLGEGGCASSSRHLKLCGRGLRKRRCGSVSV